MTSTLREVEVRALGSGGDGVAETGDGRVFVPFAAPGDVIRVRLPDRTAGAVRASIVERLKDGPDRRTPCCPHFTACGGCAVQHVATPAYAAWKRSLVAEALSHRGIDPAVVGELVPGAIGRRRRARFHARSTVKGVVLGFHAPRSRHIVALSECPVLAPGIVGLLAPLEALLADVLARGETAEITVTRCDSGLDVVLATAKAPQLGGRQRMVAFAEANDLARFAWRPLRRRPAEEPETVIRRRPPTIAFDGIAVEIPPDGFVQPTAEGEAVLREVVLRAAADAGRAADLFAGCGAFALSLAAAGMHVFAVDAAPGQTAALDSAARAGGLGPFVTTETRDLDRRPLMAAELQPFDCVVLDPPRAGAGAQARQLAEAPVPVVVYVSCHPPSFARDARVLVDGGYDLLSVTPVDQFLFSPHVELAAVLRRPA